MKAAIVALVLGVCALAYGIGVAWADDGSSAAAPNRSAPAAQPVQQRGERPRHDCPKHDGSGGRSSGSSSSSDTDV
jgi:hypothetical protein